MCIPSYINTGVTQISGAFWHKMWCNYWHITPILIKIYITTHWIVSVWECLSAIVGMHLPHAFIHSCTGNIASATYISDPNNTQSSQCITNIVCSIYPLCMYVHCHIYCTDILCTGPSLCLSVVQPFPWYAPCLFLPASQPETDILCAVGKSVSTRKWTAV